MSFLYIHKYGDVNVPTNLRPIFNEYIKRVEDFKTIDPTINGIFRHRCE